LVAAVPLVGKDKEDNDVRQQLTAASVFFSRAAWT
jgi:hypothetical protein